jgi:hypothetical protein
MKVRDIRVRHLEGCLEDAYIISDRGKDTVYKAGYD